MTRKGFTGAAPMLAMAFAISSFAQTEAPAPEFEAASVKVSPPPQNGVGAWHWSIEELGHASVGVSCRFASIVSPWGCLPWG